MPNKNIITLIPVRLSPSAKHRLSLLFDNATRHELVLAMLKDVLHAINEATEIDHRIIVSNEKQIDSIITIRNYEIFETSKTNLNQELISAMKYGEQQGATAIVIILGDLPLLTGRVLDTLIQNGSENPGIVIAQDWKGNGTNALLLNPPTALKPQFGYNSFQRHLSKARQTKLPIVCFAAIETALDLDDSQAISRFLQLAEEHKHLRKTQTYTMLRSLIKKQTKK